MESTLTNASDLLEELNSSVLVDKKKIQEYTSAPNCLQGSSASTVGLENAFVSFITSFHVIQEVFLTDSNSNLFVQGFLIHGLLLLIDMNFKTRYTSSLSFTKKPFQN